MYLVNLNQPHVRKANINKLMNELANDFFSEIRPTHTHAAYNITESNDEFNLVIALPGISKKDIEMSVEKGLLKVKANSETKEDSQYLRKEFDYTAFDRKFRLPKTINPEGISAKMEKGILTITLPKKEEAKELPPREIAIK